MTGCRALQGRWDCQLFLTFLIAAGEFTQALLLWGSLLLIPVVSLPVPSWADSLADTSVNPGVADQEAVLELIINAVSQGETFAILRGKDVLIPVADLEKAGLRGFTGERSPIGDRLYVSLASLSAVMTFEVDEKDVALKITAQPSLFGDRVVDLQNLRRPTNIIYRQDTSVFLNYSVSSQDFERYSAFTEAGLSFQGNLLYSSLSANSDGGLVRGLTHLTLNDPQNLNTVVIGDRFAETGNLGGGAFLGGINFSRNFGLDPYFVRQPTTDLAGAVTTPSTVEVYVNDSLVRREAVSPGQFELRNLPLPTGSGSTRYVIRDTFGREQIITSPFNIPEGSLEPGVQEYSYNLGFRRNNLSTESWDYGEITFLGRHRIGLTKSLTAGARMEATPNLINGGVNLNSQMLGGEVELALAASSAQGESGYAGSLAYRLLGRSIGFSAGMRVLSDRYANISLEPEDDRALWEVNATLGLPLGLGMSLSPQYSYSYFRDQGWSDRLALIGSMSLSSRASLLLSASQASQQGQEASQELFVGFNYFFGNSTTGTLSLQQGNDRLGVNAELQRSLPVGTGLGYRIQNQWLEAQNRFYAQLQYQNAIGFYEANFQKFGDNQFTSFNVAGGVVAIGGNVFLSRPVNNSFALLQVPGVAGVRGYFSNQEVGRTGRNGNLLIPNLIPYYGNRISISDQDLPINYSINITEKVIAPPLRGGVIVSFPAIKVQSFTGKIVINQGEKTLIPAYGQINVTVQDKTVTSPLGQEGEFYLENIPPGKHPATVEFPAGVCTFEFKAPNSDQSFIDLETLRCTIPSEVTR